MGGCPHCPSPDITQFDWFAATFKLNQVKIFQQRNWRYNPGPNDAGYQDNQWPWQCQRFCPNQLEAVSPGDDNVFL